MMRWLHLSWLVIAIELSSLISADLSELQVVGYLPEYQIGESLPETWSVLTDLIYFGVKPTPKAFETIPESSLQKLKRIQKRFGCRILISVGGWNRSLPFQTMTKQAAEQTAFIAHAVSFCRKHGFQGLDYDWEHPKGRAEHQAYIQLIQETQKAFRPYRLYVTVAQASWQDLGEEMYRSVDRIHLMSYDHAFPQATFKKSTKDVDQLIEWGCPSQKIVLGVPFYGRNISGKAKPYRDLVHLKISAKQSDHVNGYAWNNAKVIRQKIRYVVKREISGLMIWELGQDAEALDQSLMNVISKELNKIHSQNIK